MIGKDPKTLSDSEMVDVLHNLARAYEQDVDVADLGKVLRNVADRLSELTKAAATRRHWTGHE
jgi:hypothetical protein